MPISAAFMTCLNHTGWETNRETQLPNLPRLRTSLIDYPCWSFKWQILLCFMIVFNSILRQKMNERMVFKATILYGKAILEQRQPGIMWWILVRNMPLVQDQSPDKLTCSPVCYYCAAAAPLYSIVRQNALLKSVVWPDTVESFSGVV